MQVNGSTVKREYDEDKNLTSLNLKRIKLEDEVTIAGDLRTKAPLPIPARGAEQVPYPPECRPTSQYYAWHRHQFILDMKRRFNLESKVVTRVRFLDDGVALDWVLDKSAGEDPNHENPEDGTLRDAPTDDPVSQFSESAYAFGTKDGRAKEEIIPGLHFYNAGITVDTSGTEFNSTLDLDTDMGFGAKDEPIDPAELDMNSQPCKVKDNLVRDPTLADLKIPSIRPMSTVTEELPIREDEQQDTVKSGQLDMDQVAEIRGVHSPLVPTVPLKAENFVGGGMLARQEASAVCQRTRAASTSSSSSSSSASSSDTSALSSFSTLPAQDVDAVQTVLTRRNPTTHEKFESLREMGWKHHHSTLILRNLPQSSHVDDVRRHLQLNSLATPPLRDIRIHDSNLPECRPIATVRFGDPAEASAAMRVLTTANLPFFTSSGCETQTAIIQIEPYRPPPHWKDELLEVNDAFSSDEETVQEPRPAMILATTTISGGKDRNQRRNLSDGDPITSSSTITATVRNSSHIQPTRKNERREAFINGRPFASTSASNTEARPTRRSAISNPAGSKSQNPARLTPGLDTYNSGDESSTSSSLTSDDSDNAESPNLNNVNGTGNSGRAKATFMHEVKEIQLPSVKHGRARRLLRPTLRANPMVSVTMRGDIQFIDQKTKERLVNLSLPAKATDVHRLEDACMVDGVPVLGLSKGERGQASLVFFGEARARAELVPLQPVPHTARGILSLAPFRTSAIHDSSSNPNSETGSSFEFLSGGYDKTVQYWRVACRPGSSGRPRFSSRVSPITKAHLNSKVSALLHLPGESRVLAGVGQRLWTLDAEHRTQQSAIHFSNLINQLHAPSRKSPNIVIAEVDHLYAQMQIHDLRTSRGKPVLEFGFADTAEARHVRSHKRRGDSIGRFFVRGYQDGTVCLWDYRNVKEPVSINKSGSAITHALFAGRETRDIWVYGLDKIKFIEMR